MKLSRKVGYLKLTIAVLCLCGAVAMYDEPLFATMNVFAAAVYFTFGYLRLRA